MFVQVEVKRQLQSDVLYVTRGGVQPHLKADIGKEEKDRQTERKKRL